MNTSPFAVCTCVHLPVSRALFALAFTGLLCPGGAIAQAPPGPEVAITAAWTVEDTTGPLWLYLELANFGGAANPFVLDGFQDSDGTGEGIKAQSMTIPALAPGESLKVALWLEPVPSPAEPIPSPANVKWPENGTLVDYLHYYLAMDLRGEGNPKGGPAYGGGEGHLELFSAFDECLVRTFHNDDDPPWLEQVCIPTYYPFPEEVVEACLEHTGLPEGLCRPVDGLLSCYDEPESSSKDDKSSCD